MCTARLRFSSSTFCPHSAFMCFVWIWEQTAIISLYNISWLVFITEKECVYCAVRTGYLYIIQVSFSIYRCQTQTHVTLQLSHPPLSEFTKNPPQIPAHPKSMTIHSHCSPSQTQNSVQIVTLLPTTTSTSFTLFSCLPKVLQCFQATFCRRTSGHIL